MSCRSDSADGVGGAVIDWIQDADCQDVNRDPLPVRKLTLSHRDTTATVQAEVATESAARLQGLMCRRSVPDGAGMLFDLPATSNQGFWMYRTYVPLDLLYMRANDREDEFTVVAISTMGPCLRGQNEDGIAWRSRCVSDSALVAPSLPGFIAVLELPAGWLARRGFDLSTAVGNLIIADQ